MIWKQQLWTSLLCWGLLSCGVSDRSESQLKRNAVPNDPTANLLRVRDGDRLDFVMKSRGKGYKLVCDNPVQLNKLMEATGYPPALFGSTRIVSFDSQEARDLKISEQPELKCSSDNKVLYKAAIDGTTKFFFADTIKSKTQLHMIGCQGMVDAMGFDLSKAVTLDPMFIDSLQIYSVADEDDLSCITGVPVGAGVTWKNGVNVTKTVKENSSIDFTTFEALLPNGSPAPITVTAEKGRCEWVQKIFLGSGLLLTGQTPADFFNQSCQMTITAAAGSPLANSLSFLVTTQQVKPTLTTDCLASQQLADSTSFKACSVQTDRGTVAIAVKPLNECSKVFAFDATKGLLTLTQLPLLNIHCEAEFVSELNGVPSEPKVVAVERICATGTKPNSTGTCERVMCDATHGYNDSWVADDDASKAVRTKFCPATGTAEDRGIASCFSGYEQRGNQCLKQCRAGLVLGESANIGIGNGNKSESCTAAGLSSSISCHSGYLLRGASCSITCNGVHTDGEMWNEPITGGRQTWSCSGAQRAFQSVGCDSGYQPNGSSCQLIPPPPPTTAPCGTHAHGSSWEEAKCSTAGKIVTTYRCENGNKRTVSSVKTGEHACNNSD